MIKTIAIIPAAGSGARTGLSSNKVLHSTGIMSVLERTLIPFIISPDINKIIVVIKVEDKEAIENIISKLATDKPIITLIGGATRTQSVMNALPYTAEYDITLIHDGARPFVTLDIIKNTICTANDKGAAITGVAVTDTIKKVDNGKVTDTLDRTKYIHVQTPQAFNSAELIQAYNMIDDGNYTDDAAVYEKFIGNVSVVDGDYHNVKITTIDDFTRFFPYGFKVGIGYDVHKLVDGRKLILGGVDIPNSKGLLGHSDADCLTHSIMDAILTATGNRDIGVLFPDTDNQYLNANSLHLLDKVYNIISEQGYKISNISAEIIAEKPKLMSYITLMQSNIANILHIDNKDIMIAATTSEGLGITGEEKAIAVYAIASVVKC